MELTVGFPIDEFGSVCKFEATKSDGKKIIGKVLPKNEAQAVYDDAIAENKVALLLEEKPRGVFVACMLSFILSLDTALFKNKHFRNIYFLFIYFLKLWECWHQEST